jgi:hypothetical protein
MGFVTTLHESGLGTWVRESAYAYYVLLAIHAVGMAVVVGTIFMLCLRVLGYSKDQALGDFSVLFPVAWVGFFLNFVSGVALFAGNAEKLAQNPPFLLKISFIALGGLLQWMLWRSLNATALAPAGHSAPASPTAVSRALAVGTAAAWLFAILLGRVIGYTVG